MGDKLTGDQVCLATTAAPHILPVCTYSSRRSRSLTAACRRLVQVEEMLKDVPVDANGNFKYQAFVKEFRSDA